MRFVRRVLRLFVDNAWLASGVLTWSLTAAGAARAGAAPRLVAGLLIAGLGLILVVSVRAAARRR